ncbi:hypothetical protein FXO37_21891 [Capsicum annuum]|nr:hypothetical protein FXO37_21891 [Capsicum annuum]
MDFIYVTMGFYHGGKLQQKRCIKYHGGTVTDCFNVDVDKFSYFKFIGIVKKIGYNCSSCIVYLRPPKRKKLVIVTCDRDILGIIPQLKNGDIVELYLTHLVDEADTFIFNTYLGFEEDFVEAAIPLEPTFTKNLSGDGTVARGEDLGSGDDISSISKHLGGCGGDVSAIGEDLGDGGVAARGENLGGSGSDFFASGGTLVIVVLLLGVRT